MHPHQRWFTVADISLYQGEVFLFKNTVVVGFQGELTIAGIDLTLVNTLSGLFGYQAVVDQVSNSADLEIVFFGKALRSSRRAMVPSSFIISTITAAGSKPAIFARSQPASV